VESGRLGESGRERDINSCCVLALGLDDETSAVTVGAQSIYACAQIARPKMSVSSVLWRCV
jgi:hypothetical protein